MFSKTVHSLNAAPFKRAMVDDKEPSLGADRVALAFLVDAYDEEQVGENDNNTTIHIRKLLEIMEYDTPYSSNELMEKLGLKSRDGFQRNYLRPAINLNLIRMSIPDKPNSKNQRYIKN